MKWCCGMAALVCVLLVAVAIGYTDDELLIFAVVSEVPKDKSRVAVRASINDVASRASAVSVAITGIPWHSLCLRRSMSAA